MGHPQRSSRRCDGPICLTPNVFYWKWRVFACAQRLVQPPRVDVEANCVRCAPSTRAARCKLVRMSIKQLASKDVQDSEQRAKRKAGYASLIALSRFRWRRSPPKRGCVDFGKHETAHHICFEFWFSVLARLGAAVQIETTLKTAQSEVQTTGSFLSGR